MAISGPGSASYERVQQMASGFPSGVNFSRGHPIWDISTWLQQDCAFNFGETIAVGWFECGTTFHSYVIVAQ